MGFVGDETGWDAGSLSRAADPGQDARISVESSRNSRSHLSIPSCSRQWRPGWVPRTSDLGNNFWPTGFYYWRISGNRRRRLNHIGMHSPWV